MFYINEGKVHLHINGKRKKIISSPIIVSDGNWHRVLIRQVVMKKRKKIELTVDNASQKPQKIPQNRLMKEVYFGGIPPQFKHAKVRTN